MQLGMIAEDLSDVDVTTELIRKIAKRRFQVRRFVGSGCGRIFSKANAWAKNLKRQGCTCLVLICDLDDRNLVDFSKYLKGALGVSPIESNVIAIPVRELEAWLLADHDAISTALQLEKRMKKVRNPESIQRPKERLRDLIAERSNHRVSYVNTVHNFKISKYVKVENLNRCPSFAGLRQFVQNEMC